jgi:hypothetical protein
MNIIELAKQAGFKIDDEGEPFIYFNEQWIDVTAELTKFAQLLQQGEAVAKLTVFVNQSKGKGYSVDVNKSLDFGLYDLFTTPPDTQAELERLRSIQRTDNSTVIANLQQKLDKAREALRKIVGHDMACSVIARQALKETE